MYFLNYENLNFRFYFNLFFGIMWILKLFCLGIFGCFICGREVGGLMFVYNVLYVWVWVKKNCKICLFFNFFFCDYDLNNFLK